MRDGFVGPWKVWICIFLMFLTEISESFFIPVKWGFPDTEREKECASVFVCVYIGTWKIFESHGKNDTSIKGFNVVQHVTYI